MCVRGAIGSSDRLATSRLNARLRPKPSHGASGLNRQDGDTHLARELVATRTDEHRGLRDKCRSELCRNCVRSPRNRRQTPTFTGSHRGAFCGGKSLNRLCKEVFRCHSVSLAGFAFQACSIDHSDISPFRINDLRPRVNRDSVDCDKSSNVPRSLTGFPV